MGSHWKEVTKPKPRTCRAWKIVARGGNVVILDQVVISIARYYNIAGSGNGAGDVIDWLHNWFQHTLGVDRRNTKEADDDDKQFFSHNASLLDDRRARYDSFRRGHQIYLAIARTATTQSCR